MVRRLHANRREACGHSFSPLVATDGLLLTLDGLAVRGRAAGKYEVEVRVRNTGNRPGAEVVQLYVGFPNSIEGPPNRLKGFSREAIQQAFSKVAASFAPDSAPSFSGA
jgi:hypothetical protein